MLHLLLTRRPPALGPSPFDGFISCLFHPEHTLLLLSVSPALSPSTTGSQESHLCSAAPSAWQASSSWFYLLPVLSPGSPIRMTHSHDHLVCDFLPDSLLYMHARLPTLHKLLGTGTVSDCSLTFSSASCALSVLCRPHHGPLRHWLMVLRLCFSDAYPNHKSA